MNMDAITEITATEDVALITLRNSPSDMQFITHVFSEIAQKEINVDMISQTAPLGGKISLSFTVSDDSLGDILGIFAKLRAENPEINSVISGGNCKISLSGESMRSIPGVAAQVFDVMAELNVDIRIITTSEIDISILVSKADFPPVSEAFEKAFGLRIKHS